MGKIEHITCKLLSNKKMTVLILAVIIISRLLQLLYLFNTRNDMSYQIQAAQALYEGHGVSLPKIFADDLSAIHYQPLVQWPPGFSILFIPFYLLCGQNYMLAALVLNLLSALVVIFFTRGILKLLATSLYLLNCFTILTGFSLYYFYLKPCTDSTAIAFFIVAIYFIVSLFKSDYQADKKTVAIAIMLLGCGFIKYLYLPVIFIVPVFILAKGFFEKKNYLKRAGSFLLIVIFIIFGAFLIYQKYSSNTIGYIKEPDRGFYPENLLATHPFIPASFIKPETLEWLTHWSPHVAMQALRVFQAIHLFLFILLIIYGVNQFIKKRKNQSFASSFLMMSLVLSFLIAALLTLLSLRVAKEPVDGGVFWTYVEEPRYYGTIHIFLHLATFIVFQAVRFRHVFKWVLYFLFTCLFFEMFRGIMFTANRLIHFNKEIYGWQQELLFERHTSQLVSIQKAQQQANQVVLAGTSDWFTLRAGLYCKLPIFEEASKLNNLSEVNTKKPVLLFVIMQKEQVINFGAFINSHKTKYAGTADGFLFYTQIITPR